MSRKFSDKTGMVIDVPVKSAYATEESAAMEAVLGGEGADVCGMVADDSAKTGDNNNNSNFYFVVPSDTETVTDYLYLLYAQVTRGILNEGDFVKANASSRNRMNLGFLGFRCRHCCGASTGNYFPTCVKNLQATTSTLAIHLSRCSMVPQDIKIALKRMKIAHKTDVQRKPKGGVKAFFASLWFRIHSPDFVGARNAAEMHSIIAKLNSIVQSTANTSIVPAEGGFELPAVISYSDKNRPLIETPVVANMKSRNHEPSTVTDEDFEIALSLLRQDPTPDNSMSFEEEAPRVDISPARVTVTHPLQRPPSLGFKGGIDSQKSAERPAEPKSNKSKKKKPSKAEATAGKTRKFTREADILLVRGMLKYKKKHVWKKIYDENPGLHSVLQSALKDRARTHRFQTILARAELDPTLLDRPDELFSGNFISRSYAEFQEVDVDEALETVALESEHVLDVHIDPASAMSTSSSYC